MNGYQLPATSYQLRSPYGCHHTFLALVDSPPRLRRTEAIRSLVRETRLTPDCFIYPLFVCAGEGGRREIGSMPGVFQLSVDEAVKEATAAKSDGVPAVILFGLPETKDAEGAAAYDPDAPVQTAVRALNARSATCSS